MKRVTTLKQLEKLTRENRAVTWPGVAPKPAVFVFAMTGRTIWMLMRKGLYVYKKGQK